MKNLTLIQEKILLTLKDIGKPCNIYEIAGNCELGYSTANVNINLLIVKGLVRKIKTMKNKFLYVAINTDEELEEVDKILKAKPLEEN